MRDKKKQVWSIKKEKKIADERKKSQRSSYWSYQTKIVMSIILNIFKDIKKV